MFQDNARPTPKVKLNRNDDIEAVLAVIAKAVKREIHSKEFEKHS